jgi:hypothetical protein
MSRKQAKNRELDPNQVHRVHLAGREELIGALKKCRRPNRPGRSASLPAVHLVDVSCPRQSIWQLLEGAVGVPHLRKDLQGAMRT